MIFIVCLVEKIEITPNNDGGIYTIVGRLKEYGKDESNKMSVVPYIVNVEAIRGTDEDKVSKVLFYSKYFRLKK